MSEGYRDVLGSDVINDGMYLELRDPSDIAVACVFRSDVSGEFKIDVGPNPVPSPVLESFLERAKKYCICLPSDVMDARSGVTDFFNVARVAE